MRTQFLMAVLSVFVLFAGCREDRRSDVFLIPKGYVGPIRIQYGVQGASPLQINGNSFYIVIPPDGLLKTSTDPESGWGDDRFYYSGKIHERLYQRSEPYRPGETPPTPMVWNGVVTVDKTKRRTLMYFIGSKQQLTNYQKAHYWP